MSIEELILPIGGLVLVGFTLFSGGTEQGAAILQDGKAVKEQRRESAKEQVAALSTQDHLSQMAEVAAQRYEAGCTFHYVKADFQRPETAATGATDITAQPIAEGMMPINWQGRTYSRGQVVCDTSGNTGVIDGDGRVQEYARNGTLDVGQYNQAWLARHAGGGQ
jgi:hypothetical protein